ncbi:MAG: ComEC/Rec2 family competence protein, partial [Alphaproteobacteria bacterium]|nr:ComEC/Rec2 family competence protein [Alphaproteobacteria bacterium]
MTLGNFVAEQDRGPLWLAVALGAGAAGYFTLPVEPSLPLGWAAVVLGLGAAVITIKWHWRLGLVAALLLGFGLAKLREAAVTTPVLDHALVTHLTGRIASLEPREQGVRVVLDDIRSGALPQPPRRVRVALRSGGDFRPGEWLSLTARLDTPPPPSEPGANDLGRSLFFQSIGAVGFAYGKARVIVPACDPDWRQRIGATVEELRLGMTRRIQTVLPGSTGGIASALITGERGGISDEDEEALRDAGLAHVLAIAGLHMALVGGGIFWLLRAVLAAIPALALNYPIKKWAAAGALAAGSFYLVASGASPSSVRAFVMLACVMVAVLLDRPALSMRSLALAAAILLVLRPEAIAEPGFQMSFAAVAGLVAVAEWEMRRERSTPRGAATLPFALFHFERATHYAVLGNLIAMPVMGFWVMPAAAILLVLRPEAIAEPGFQMSFAAVAGLVAVAEWEMRRERSTPRGA